MSEQSLPGMLEPCVILQPNARRESKLQLPIKRRRRQFCARFHILQGDSGVVQGAKLLPIKCLTGRSVCAHGGWAQKPIVVIGFFVVQDEGGLTPGSSLM